MVKAGLGVSVMPMWAIQAALARREVRAVRITPAGIHRQWSAATLRGVNEPRYLLDFLKLMPGDRQSAIDACNVRRLSHLGESDADARGVAEPW